MKANRKFMNGDDEAVSPVIAVILMVAITVVLAATVYVWVSGFGAQSSNPAKAMSLTSDGAIGSTQFKNYTVSSATPGMKWSDITLSLDGSALSYDDVVTSHTDEYCVALTGSTCVDTTTWDAGGSTGKDAVIQAGQKLSVKDASISGQTLRILDANANSVVLTLTVG